MELENEAIGATRTVSAFRQTTLSVICEENYFEHSIIWTAVYYLMRSAHQMEISGSKGNEKNEKWKW